MISHRNVIANVIQYTTYESVSLKARGVDTQVSLGLLPYSHIYGLVVVTHGSTYRGDEIIVLPKYELEMYLGAVQRFKIQHMPLVPPIVIQMLRNQETCRKYDLSSVRFIYTGAAPLGAETVGDLHAMYPKWTIGQGYGEFSLRELVAPTIEC
jgi:acyl-CoA synthetase (AMP-forming)/AMP-acid ligase II